MQAKEAATVSGAAEESKATKVGIHVKLCHNTNNLYIFTLVLINVVKKIWKRM